MSGQVEIAGAYQLPRSIAVTQGTLGKSFRIEIGQRHLKATLPVLVWQDDEPIITFPEMEPVLENALGQRLKAPSPLWPVAGRVTACHPNKRTASECHVGAIVLRFSVAAEDVELPTEAHGRTSYQGVIPGDVRTGIEPWFYRVRMWIEATTDQDTDPDIPLERRGSGRLSLFRMEAGGIGELASWGGGMTATRFNFEPINLRQLRRIVVQANLGALPSDAHLLMRDARAALRRQRTRLAVIDAGTAVEMTLAAFNQAGPNLQPSRGQPTLGWYVRELQNRAQLPADTDTALVEVRNDAAHRNRQPTRAEALRALAIGKEILDRLDPLSV